MSTTIAAVNSPSIRHSEFVRITLPTRTINMCSAASPITVNGVTFTALNTLMSIEGLQREIQTTNNDLLVTVSGIDNESISLVLGAELMGSMIEIWRGFFDSDNQIITTPTLQFFKRYQGIITNMSINEQFNEELRKRFATCTVTCSSIKVILENRLAGIKTNQVSWQKIYPNDSSMNRVQQIVAQYFDFGAEPKRGSQAVPTGNTNKDPYK